MIRQTVLITVLLCMTSIPFCGCSAPSKIPVAKTAKTANYSEVAHWPIGARVRIDYHVPDLDFTIVGTVLTADANGVALCNCELNLPGEPSTLGIPFLDHWLEMDKVTVMRLPIEWVWMKDIAHAQIIEPPASDFDISQLGIDTDDTNFKRPYVEECATE